MQSGLNTVVVSRQMRFDPCDGKETRKEGSGCRVVVQIVTGSRKGAHEQGASLAEVVLDCGNLSIFVLS
jgi:hypothetical protein